MICCRRLEPRLPAADMRCLSPVYLVSDCMSGTTDNHSGELKKLLDQLGFHDVALDFQFARRIGLHGGQFARN